MTMRPEDYSVRRARMCGSKLRFPSRRVARGVRRVIAALTDDPTWRNYGCPYCHGHHIGRTPPTPLPQRVIRVRASVDDEVDITWRRPDGTEVNERRTAPEASAHAR